MTAEPFAGIRGCVFDAYGTLFDGAAAAARCRDALGGEAKGSPRCGATSNCNIAGCAACRGGTPIFGR
jgi:hypothetical protein